MSNTTDYIIENDITFNDLESGASHSPNQCNLCGKIVDERAIQEQCGFSLCISCDGKYSDEELSEKKVEWYADEFLKVGEKRSLAELATGIIDCETTLSHTQFIGIFDNVLKYKLSKLNKERGRS